MDGGGGGGGGGVHGGLQGHCHVLCWSLLELACLLAFPSLPPTLLGKYQFHTLVVDPFSVVLTGAWGGLWLGCHGGLITAEEIAAFLCCYLYGTYPPIIQLA